MSKFSKEVNECLLKIQQGNKEQIEQLIDITAVHLKSVARLYLTNKDFDEDVLSNTYINVLLYIDSFDPKQDGYNWLCKIVQNFAITKNETENKIAATETEFLKDRETVYNDLYDVDFFLAIKGLSKTDRTIAYLRFYLDQPQQVIGDYLHISKPAVCKRLKKICKIIEENYKNR